MNPKSVSDFETICTAKRRVLSHVQNYIINVPDHISIQTVCVWSGPYAYIRTVRP